MSIATDLSLSLSPSRASLLRRSLRLLSAHLLRSFLLRRGPDIVFSEIALAKYAEEHVFRLSIDLSDLNVVPVTLIASSV